MLQKTELWFVPVMNPDGYQYTFRPRTRLWRKNLRDNNGNGDDRGRTTASTRTATTPSTGTTTRRARRAALQRYLSRPVASSEPETGADAAPRPDQVRRSWSTGTPPAVLLYPEGWQIGTPSADDPIYYALSGNLSDPAIPGFHPGPEADVLYVTNGESTDFAHPDHGTLAWTPELEEGCSGCGFLFPDDEALVQGEFERCCPSRRTWSPRRPTRRIRRHTSASDEAVLPASDDTFKAASRRELQVRGLLRRSADGRGAGAPRPRARRRSASASTAAGAVAPTTE